MHISDKIAATLMADGWSIIGRGTNLPFYTKRHTFPELAGTISNGTRVVTLTICERGRYLARVDGCGRTIRDVDLRDFPNDPTGAIAKVMEI